MWNFIFCFSFSGRNSRLEHNTLSGYRDAAGYGGSFCTADVPSIPKASQRIHTPDGDSSKQQEIHRRSLGGSDSTLEKGWYSDLDNHQTSLHCSLVEDLWHSFSYSDIIPNTEDV